MTREDSPRVAAVPHAGPIGDGTRRPERALRRRLCDALCRLHWMLAD